MKPTSWIVFICLLFSRIASAEISSDCKEMIEYIQHHLPTSGTLYSSSNGFVYVKVDDDYIHKCCALIQEEGFAPPPYFGQRYDSGAHISLIYPEEWGNREPFLMAEVGEKLDFQLGECHIFETPHWEGIKEVMVVLVDSLALENLRKKYGFPPGFHFHITIGVKTSEKQAA